VGWLPDNGQCFCKLLNYDTNFSVMNVLLKRAPLPSAYKRLVNPLLRRLLLRHTVQVVLERAYWSCQISHRCTAKKQKRMFDMVGAGRLGWVAITLVIYAGIWLYLWISEWFHSGKT
jgi:hypothetical protein